MVRGAVVVAVGWVPADGEVVVQHRDDEEEDREEGGEERAAVKDEAGPREGGDEGAREAVEDGERGAPGWEERHGGFVGLQSIGEGMR